MGALIRARTEIKVWGSFRFFGLKNWRSKLYSAEKTGAKQIQVGFVVLGHENRRFI
jgi:hypothetical protein